MQRILIQLDGRLLWQILVGTDPALLQRLDELLRILADQAQAETPLVAYCTETDWTWLHHQIQSHYSFDLAEELLLRLDVICLCPPDPGEPVYAVLTDAASATGVSLEEFLNLYQAMRSLEFLYRQLPEAQPQIVWTRPELTAQQARMLLVSLALLALLPHLTTLQQFLLGRAEAADLVRLLSDLSQVTQGWIEQAALPARPVRQVQELQQPSVAQPSAAPAPVFGFNPGGLEPAVVPLIARPAPLGHLSPLIQPLGQEMLAAVPDATSDRADLAARPSAQTDSVTSKPPSRSPAAAQQPSAVQEPAAQLNQPQPLAPTIPRPAPASPTPTVPPRLEQPRLEPPRLKPPNLDDSRPADLRPADLRPADLTVALHNGDPLLRRAAISMPEQPDALLVTVNQTAVARIAVYNQSREPQFEEPLGQLPSLVAVRPFEQTGQTLLIALPSPLDLNQIGPVVSQPLV